MTDEQRKYAVKYAPLDITRDFSYIERLEEEARELAMGLSSIQCEIERIKARISKTFDIWLEAIGERQA